MTENKKLVAALTRRLGEQEKENIELTERVKELMDDYNRVARQLRELDGNGKRTKALKKIKQLKIDKDVLSKECTSLHKCYVELRQQYKAAKDELQKAGDTLKQLQDDKALLREQLDIANANCKKAEEERVEANEKIKEQRRELRFAFRHYRRFEHADFLSMEHDCPHYTGAEVEVGDLSCLGCAHFLKADFDKTKHILCAYNYDEEKEKQQEEDNFHRKMNQSLNS